MTDPTPHLTPVYQALSTLRERIDAVPDPRTRLDLLLAALQVAMTFEALERATCEPLRCKCCGGVQPTTPRCKYCGEYVEREGMVHAGGCGNTG